MFTSVDKAWAAFFSSGAFLGSFYLGFDLGLPDAAFAAIGTGVTAVLTWLVPNKPPVA